MSNESKGKNGDDAFMKSLNDYAHGRDSDSNALEIKEQIRIELEMLDKRINPNIENHFFLIQKIRETYKADDISAIEQTKQYCIEMIDKAFEARKAFLKGGWVLRLHADNIKNGLGIIDDDKIKLKLLRSQIKAVKAEPQKILPVHLGYQKICIILENEKNYTQSLFYANKAESEGWGSDWAKRIEKLKKKIETDNI